MEGFGHLPSCTGFSPCWGRGLCLPPPWLRGTTSTRRSGEQRCAFHHLASQNSAYLIGSRHHLLSRRSRPPPPPLMVPTATSPSSREQQMPLCSLTASNACSAPDFFPNPCKQASAPVAITPAPRWPHQDVEPRSLEPLPISTLTAQAPRTV